VLPLNVRAYFALDQLPKRVMSALGCLLFLSMSGQANSQNKTIPCDATTQAKDPLTTRGSLDQKTSIALQPIAENIWLIPAQLGESDTKNRGLTSNLTLIRDGKRLWLFGSGPNPAVAREIVCRVKQELGLMITDVINPRPYAEVTLGNLGFYESNGRGPKIWAHQQIIAVMSRRCLHCSTRMADRSGVNVPINYATVPKFSVKGRRGQLGPLDWYLVQRYSESAQEPSMIAYHRASRTWLTAGLVWGSVAPDLRDADIDSLQTALAMLKANSQPIDRLIPEQGAVQSINLLAQEVAYWQGLKRLATKAIDQLEDASRVDEMVKEQIARGQIFDVPLTAGLNDRVLFPQRHSLNLQRAWRAAESTR
jgi:hypothetical protein